MKFGTPASLLTLGAAIAFLAPFAAAAPAPSGVDSAPMPMETEALFKVTIFDHDGQQTVRRIVDIDRYYSGRSRLAGTDLTSTELVDRQESASLTFTPEEAAQIRSMHYTSSMSLPIVHACYAQDGSGASIQLNGLYSAPVENPSGVTCGMLWMPQVGLAMEASLGLGDANEVGAGGDGDEDTFEAEGDLV